MKVTINWLSDYVDIDITPEELADRLVKVGFEVEEIIHQNEKITGVVTGKILTRKKHPDADKLSVCTVDVGAVEPVQIVCGACNCDPTNIVPVALHNANLDGYKIKKGKIRGEVSNGMMCGGSEIGLTEADYEGAGFDGLFILPKNTPLGVNINEITHTNDVVMDIEITANRPDCNSIIGLAKEIAGILGKSIKKMPVSYITVKQKVDDKLSVEVIATDLCPRYMARVIDNVKVEKAPEYIRRRLKAVGLRPINNIVDITNYVLFEIGQPMHAFDIRLIEDSTIIVRRAIDKEKIIALDEIEYSLNNSNLVICDKNKPVAIGGVMGGIGSGIKSDTATVVLESANFNRENIRRTSRQLNLRSDSSSRFEKGIDYLSQELALERALTLLGGEVLDGTIDFMSAVIVEKSFTYTAFEISKILGVDVASNTIIDILTSLEIPSTIKDGQITSHIPLNRDDIDGINDIAEEVIRIYGYDHIKPTDLLVRGGRNREQKIEQIIKQHLVSNSMYEIINYSFITPKSFDMLNLAESNPLRQAIPLMNPLGEDLSVMRTTLVHSLIKTASKNIAKGNKAGRLFEVARTYIPKELPINDLPDEIIQIGICAFGNNEDFFTLKSAIQSLYDLANADVKFVRSKIEYLHNGISADIMLNDRKIGYLGELHPDVINNYGIKSKLYVAELEIEPIKASFDLNKQFVAIPKYPAIDRDLALVVDDNMLIGELIEYIKAYNSLIRDVTLFDVYSGEQVEKGRKSIALSVVMRDNNRTLTLEETAKIYDSLIENLATKYNAKLR